MPISFNLRSLRVRNFRGLTHLDLDLVPGEPTYIIGPNNSSKSTVVAAMALALRGGGFHKFVPREYDFHHPPSGPRAERFFVTLTFYAPDGHSLPAVQGAGNPEYVHGVEVRGDFKIGGSPSHKRYLIDAEGKGISYSSRTPLKGARKEEFKEHQLGWSPAYARLDDIRHVAPEIWLLRPDNLYRSLYEWRTGPLQLLARLVSAKFRATEWEFEYAGKARAMPGAIAHAHEFAVQAIAAFPFWRDDVKPRLDAALSDYLGRQSRVNLQTSIQSMEEWVAQQLLTGFASDGGGALTPLQSMGDGWQSLVRLAALDVLRHYPEAGVQRVVLLFEEPETYLHPHLRRKLRDVLADLAQAGWTVIATTHAPEFISLRQPQRIHRLRREGGAVHKGTFNTATSTDAARLQEKLDERGNHELFFAQRVILCEGKDDVFALRMCFEKQGVDFDGAGITVLDVGGVENMPDYASMLNALGVPWCAITDEDALPDGTIKAATARVRKKLSELKCSACLTPVWPGNLETCLGITAGSKAKPQWQQSMIAPKPLASLRSDHPDLFTTADAVEAWLA